MKQGEKEMNTNDEKRNITTGWFRNPSLKIQAENIYKAIEEFEKKSKEPPKFNKKILIVPESIYEQAKELYDLELVEVKKIPEGLGLGSNTVYIMDEDIFNTSSILLAWNEEEA